MTEQALNVGIAMMRAGNKTGDVSAAIQQYVEAQGFHVVREYTGHGVGRKMHEGPQVPNYGTPGTGILLKTWNDHRPRTDGTHRYAPDPCPVQPVDGCLC